MSKKILALDLGITSLGYSILEELGEHSYSCLDSSVIMRDAPYDKDGNSNQTVYRGQKSQRALIHKRQTRIKNTAKVFEKFGILDFASCMLVQHDNNITDKWRLRAKDALQRSLSPQELFAIMSHMAKHRGYKSIATEDLLYELEMELGLIEEHVNDDEAQKDEKRQVYAALNKVENLKKQYHSETISEVIHRAVQEGKLHSYRNHDDYEKMIRREDIEDEIETIIQKQCEFGALKLTSSRCSEFIEALHEVITDQVMPENDTSLFGKCAYYPTEIAAPKYSYLYDLFRLYKTVSDLKITNFEIETEDREKIIGYLHQKIKNGKNINQITYKEVRKILSLNDNQKIYGKDDDIVIKGKSSARSLIKFFFLSDIAKFPTVVQKISQHEASIDLFGKVSELAREHKTPRPAIDAIEELLSLHGIETDKSELLELIRNKKPGTLSVSHRFIIDALPHLQEGKSETDIKEILGVKISEDYSSYPKSLKNLHLGKDNPFEMYQNKINNHAIKSLGSWILQRIADLSWRYGAFDEIIVESARDALPKSIQEAIDKGMREREKEIDKIIEAYKNEFPTIDRKMAKKIKLLESQKFMDIYSGDMINISDLFEGRADIEHIVPKSLGGLSADYNLVIAHRNSNMKKSNLLPMDWLNEDSGYVNRVESLFKEHLISWKKRKNLLAKSLDETYVEVSDTKALRATSYLEALVTENLKMFYPFQTQAHRANGVAVRNIPGKTTSKARSLLGIKSKSRDTNFHHVEDALILATLNRGWQNRLHRMLKDNYGKSEKELKTLWEKFTPHIEGVAIGDYVKEAFERFMSMDEESLWYRDMFGGRRSISYWINKKPLSASSHKDTVYSAKHAVPTLRKSITGAFDGLGIVKDRHKLDGEYFKEIYEKEIRKKLWLYHIGNLNDPVLRAIDNRADEIVQVLHRYENGDIKKDKELDETFVNELNNILRNPIDVDGKIVRKTRFVYTKLNAVEIDRGLVETDKNMLGVFISKAENNRVKIERMDVNNAPKLLKRNSGLKVYLNEMIYLFNEKKVIHYGCLRSYVEKTGNSKLVALFNPRFPASPKSQPKMFSTGSQIKQVSVGSATGVIKVHLDLSGQIKSYEKFGMISKELENEFLQECGYGSMEKHPDH
ncbi:type II CRISPR RNA-guided endonuclease Cas9 [Sulfurovum sp.]|uniref:type II CRISPR RNA-guided endonuclease Cas9 n=1 Tax=Sulfurovum sp. TaxID=1969726 RepID=UPI002A35DA09|nr:type II CRISPR RNA-guided endonuclease Cas9 [Sulfurovum sp.]MDY0401992.1 type II CRISPR RNA-guided endonuclease Cas9 [Sulfurovum sp.]